MRSCPRARERAHTNVSRGSLVVKKIEVLNTLVGRQEFLAKTSRSPVIDCASTVRFSQLIPYANLQYGYQRARKPRETRRTLDERLWRLTRASPRTCKQEPRPRKTPCTGTRRGISPLHLSDLRCNDENL